MNNHYIKLRYTKLSNIFTVRLFLWISSIAASALVIGFAITVLF